MANATSLTPLRPAAYRGRYASLKNTGVIMKHYMLVILILLSGYVKAEDTVCVSQSEYENTLDGIKFLVTITEINRNQLNTLEIITAIRNSLISSDPQKTIEVIDRMSNSLIKLAKNAETMDEDQLYSERLERALVDVKESRETFSTDTSINYELKLNELMMHNKRN